MMKSIVYLSVLFGVVSCNRDLEKDYSNDQKIALSIHSDSVFIEDKKDSLSKNEKVKAKDKLELAFETFKSAMLSRNEKLLESICDFPVQDDFSYDEADTLGKIKQVKQGNVGKIFYILNKTDLEVLRKFQIGGKEVKVRGSEGWHNAELDKNYARDTFAWIVGCIELVGRDTGEYNYIFEFEMNSQGDYKLQRISMAG